MTVKNFFPAGENKLFDAGGGLTRKVAAYNDNVMCVEVHFETGTVAALHSHPTNRSPTSSPASSSSRSGTTPMSFPPGDSLYKQPNIVHGATCLEAGTLLDIFTPHREDFI